MRILLLAVLLGAISGCARDRKQTPPPDAAPASISTTNAQGQIFTVTRNEGLNGRVVSVNPNLRFVVMTFPVGRMPVLEQRLYVYRNGLSVGEVRVSGPRTTESIVADIVSGEAQKGDEIRDR